MLFDNLFLFIFFFVGRWCKVLNVTSEVYNKKINNFNKKQLLNMLFNAIFHSKLMKNGGRKIVVVIFIENSDSSILVIFVEIIQRVKN